MDIKQRFIDFARKNPKTVVFLGYVLLSLIFTFPLVLSITSQIPEGRGDIYQSFGNINSRVVALQGLDFSQKAVFLLKNFNVFLPYVVLNMFIGKYLAWNLMLLASFALSGLGMYLLAMYFVKNKTAAFLAGIIFAFAPFHFYEATVVNVGTMHQEWLPFFALFLFKFFEKFKFKYFAAFTFFTMLIAMEEHQMLAFAFIFAGIFFVYNVIQDKQLLKNKKLWAYVAAILGLLGLLAVTMFKSMLNVATSDNNFLSQGINAANKYSIKFLDPLIPPVFHPLWGSASAKLQEFIWSDTNKGSYFIGFSVIFAVTYLGYLIKKKKVVEISQDFFRKSLLFWSITTALFYIFSLGPSIGIGKFNLYLPYYLIFKFVPFYENIRTTGRMVLFVMLGISMLFAYAFIQIQKKYSAKKIKIAIIFAAFIMLEFWVAPIKTMNVEHSKFYDMLANEQGSYKLIEIPGSTSYEFASYDLYLQSIHGKEVLNGMPLARKISKQFAMQKNTPVVKQLLYTIPKGNDPEKKVENYEQVFSQANKILNENNVRYITINKKFTKAKIITMEENFINKYIKFDERYEDEFIIAYKVAK